MKHLVETLGISAGITAFVGAGGKTSTIRHLAQELRQRGDRVAITTTTHMFPSSDAWIGKPLLAPSLSELDAAAQRGICIAAQTCDANGKLAGIAPETLQELNLRFNYVLVEADGSRRMPLKVPAGHEPQIPDQTNHVVGVVGLSALHKPLAEVCFRAELAATHLQIDNTTILQPIHLARIASSSWGLKKQVGEKTFTILLNQADLAAKQAIDVAQLCLQFHAAERVVIASLQQGWWQVQKEGNRC